VTVIAQEDIWLDAAGAAVPAGSPRAIQRFASAGARMSDRTAIAFGLVNGRAPAAPDPVESTETPEEPDDDHPDAE